MKNLCALAAAVMVSMFPAVTGFGGSQQDEVGLDGVLSALSFRNIGPFRTAAWVTEIAVPETPARDHLYTIYAATRTGGLWKTTNNGITWNPISDSVSVGGTSRIRCGSCWAATAE